jgi:hypothetical protein
VTIFRRVGATIPVPPLVADVNEGTIIVLNVVAFGMMAVTASMSIVRLQQRQSRSCSS